MIRRFFALLLIPALLLGIARAAELPNSTDGLPNTAAGLPNTTTGLPGEADGLPNTATGLPNTAAGLPGLVRLQVVAESDSAKAQALKLEIRDACLGAARICLADAPDADAAYARLVAHLDDFRSVVEGRARALGYAGAVRAEAGVFAFPDRVYGRLFVPAGRYRALRVTIGAGAGRNWWCVLYPSLCALNEADAAGKIDIRRALEWLRARLFGGERP